MSPIHYPPLVDFEKCSIEKERCSRADLLEIGNEILKAFTEIGFVYLKNCGITDEYVRQVQETTGKFFRSAETDKQRYKREGEINFGFIGIGTESPDPTIPADYKEAFNVNGESFHKVDRRWPEDIVPGFKNTMLSFMERGKVLGMRILNALALAMELEDEHFFVKPHSDMHIGNTYTCTRSLYYPPVKAKDLVPGQIRLGEHADTSTISIVFQDETGGLQVRNVDGKFVEAKPIEGTALVNVGDMLEFWSCGTLKSTRHRVMIPDDDERSNKLRRSLVYFVYPNNDTAVNIPLVYKDKSKNRQQPEQIVKAEELVLQQIRDAWKTKEGD